jgi:hypothetical protein
VSMACSYYAVYTAMWVALGDPPHGKWSPPGIFQMQDLVPPGDEFVPLEWTYDGEDHHFAVFVDEGVDRRALEGWLLDAVTDYDEEHGTYTMCIVWPKQRRMLAGIR